ncbi:hypothetical protein BU26DRAFT_299002 [Trematosphaeria pertusa]|uniref:Uncharacterized protein n=1 Tax=Trematosphaeria pertusa TaxID=390896 RepID=A0A6A6IIN7_9PLEO|nr:uncharacterized protein BU26DRAFT_299002 [Trematosphaeria pertusa]KAF2250281.1 hypothetical protein BU26DRAFT_299002 [Trematosphaeria pertusa]
MDSHGIAPARNSGSQQQWIANVTSCDRPAPDLAIPVHCSLVYNDDQERNPSEDFDLFGSCCPPVENSTNIWSIRRGCDADCWTYNVDLGFADCVNRTAEEANHTRVGAICEYVDYGKLAQAVQSGASPRKGSLKVTLGIVCVVVAFIAAG